MGIILRNNKTITPSIVIEKSDEWQPDADMVWAKSVCENDVQEGSFPYGKFLAMTDNEQSTTVITIPGGGAVKTSDGSYYTYDTSGSSVTHTWDDKNARQSTVGDYKLRWLIYYFSLNNVYLNIPIRTLYVCCNGAIKIRSPRNEQYAAFAPLLKYIELINGSYFASSLQSASSNIEKIDYIFDYTYLNNPFGSNYSLKEVNIIPVNSVKPTTLNSLFYRKYLLTNIKGLDKLDTSKVTSMQWLFYSCISLKELDLSNFNTSNVDNMSGMFDGCRNLKKIKGLENWNTSKVTNMSSMFNYITTTEVNFSNFDTNNVTDMSNMFGGWLGTNIDVHNFNTSKVTNMSGMFNETLLEELDLSNFDFSSCKNMGTMFNGSRYLKKIIGLDVSNATSLYQTFTNCWAIEELHLDSHNVTDFYGAFWGCNSLKTLSLDLNSSSNNKNLFNTENLEFLTITNIKKDISISSSTKYSRETLLGIINNLVDLTGQTAQTLTMGSTNLAKLTDEDKQIATNKNWSIQ